MQDQQTKPYYYRHSETRNVISSKTVYIAMEEKKNTMEDVIKFLDKRKRGINVSGEYISHLFSDDDVIVIAKSLGKIGKMKWAMFGVSQNSIRNEIICEKTEVTDITRIISKLK